VGWCRGRAIGVDVELQREMRDEAALVRRYFSPAEIAAYEALPPLRRTEGFYNAWTRKEAYVKAVGRGLGLSLASFDVSLDSGPGARLLRPSAEVAGPTVGGATVAGDNAWSLAAPHDVEGAAVAVVLQAPALKLTPAVPMSR
jgi:phosphopantetheine--protein transferase-like protein